MKLFQFLSALVSKAPEPPPAQPVRSEPRKTARAVPIGPAVPPVGIRGETDLEPGPPAPGGVHYPSVDANAGDLDRAAVRELFSEIAAGQAAPVRTFVGSLQTRTANREWLEICRPVMAVLLESATSLELGDATEPMSEFASALDLAAESGQGQDGEIDDASRELILETYGSMAKAFPAAFALGGAENRRDSMLLHALLKQVQGVGIVTLDALYGAGLTSLEAVAHATAGELATTTGVAAPLCEAICRRLRDHQQEVEKTSHLPAEHRHSARLRELLTTLTREQDAYERLADGAAIDEARSERKRAARRSRNLCGLKIEACLVEMGDIERADKMRALSFDKRIEFLAQFLGVRVVKRPTEQRSR